MIKILPKEVIEIIGSYLGCFESKFKISCKLLNINNCKVISFKRLKQCSQCGDKDMITIIDTFSKLNPPISTIHFTESRVLKKSLPYIGRYFGPISHQCCEGKGVMMWSAVKKYNNY